MYRYCLKRVRDTIEFGVNVRKSFACQQNVSVKQPQNDHPAERKSVVRAQEIQFIITHRAHDEFKQKYNCRHPNSRSNILQAITWSTALIAGFYASQLMCLYRRKHRLQSKNCFYRKYLCLRNQQLHKTLVFAQHELDKKKNNPHTSHVPKDYLSSIKEETRPAEKSSVPDTADEPFHFPGFEKFFEKRFQKYYEDDANVTYRSVYHVNNDKKEEKTKPKSDENVPLNKENDRDEKFNQVFSSITKMIGQVELQLGIECIRQELFAEAAEHFKLSTNSNNDSACYNLALLYENGLGVEKDLEMAKKLYQLAGEWGNCEALYNLGVFFARGLGGTKKSFRKAKLCFEKAAKLGDSSAKAALDMLKPRKFSSEPEDFIEHDVDSLTLDMTKNGLRQSVAVG